ncbi:hypothetical protein FB645_006130 [Coemansia sp. IMI 203386]|nr:hypothetical protein FB645_006130 [Coemansia sp. IMI 203386]
MRVQDSYSEFPVRAIVIMGVSGCGKSTIGKHLAELLGSAPFIDADSLHPAQNIEMMKNGQPLSDRNRWFYREFLSRGDPENACADRLTHDTVFVYVDVPKAELARRLQLRKNHFFNGALLDSQLETLEPPDVTREAALIVYGDGSEPEVAHDVYRQVCGYVTKNSL